MQNQNLNSFTPSELLGPLNDIELKYAPKELFISGKKQLLTKSLRVAVVGTRNPSEEGMRRTARLIRELVQKKCIIVSGLAKGIDTIAHSTTIKAGGRTIAVLGNSLDEFYPKSNIDLQKTIAKEHLLISQFPSGYPTTKRNFVMRNRTMALVSETSVIVEAGDGSGTLHQGWEMLRLGRPLFIMKSTCENKEISWPLEMLKYGAVCLSESSDLFDFFPNPAESMDQYIAV